MTDDRSRRVLPPWTWPALDRLEERIDRLEASVRSIDEVLQQVNHAIQHQGEVLASVNHRSQLLDEVAHLTRHLDHGFNQVRDQVEIVSALTLALQRQAERQGLVPDGPPPSA
jgi:methyl-accepting chemotaxis protein